MNIFLMSPTFSVPLFLAIDCVLWEKSVCRLDFLKNNVETTTLTTNYNPMNIFLMSPTFSVPLFLAIDCVLREKSVCRLDFLKNNVETTTLTTNYNPMNIFLMSPTFSVPLFLQFCQVQSFYLKTRLSSRLF